MHKLWSWFSLFFLFHIVVWIQSPRLPYPSLISKEISPLRLIEYINISEIILALSTSLFIALLTIGFCLIFTVPTALILTKSKNKFTRALSYLLYLPILAPFVLPGLGLYELFMQYEFTGTLLSISLAQSCLLYPYMLKPIEDFLVIQGHKYQSISQSLGADSIETFLKVTLPSLKSAISIGSFFVFVGSFNDYIISFLLGDFKIKTLSVILYPLMQSDNRMTSVFIIILYSLPLIILIFLINLFIRRSKDA